MVLSQNRFLLNQTWRCIIHFLYAIEQTHRGGLLQLLVTSQHCGLITCVDILTSPFLTFVSPNIELRVLKDWISDCPSLLKLSFLSTLLPQLVKSTPVGTCSTLLSPAVLNQSRTAHSPGPYLNPLTGLLWLLQAQTR